MLPASDACLSALLYTRADGWRGTCVVGEARNDRGRPGREVVEVVNGHKLHGVVREASEKERREREREREEGGREEGRDLEREPAGCRVERRKERRGVGGRGDQPGFLKDGATGGCGLVRGGPKSIRWCVSAVSCGGGPPMP